VAVGGEVGELGEVTPTAEAMETGTWLTEVMIDAGAGATVSTSEVPLPWFSWWRTTTRAPSRMTAMTMSPRAA
jgi:hypothetical protein